MAELSEGRRRERVLCAGGGREVEVGLEEAEEVEEGLEEVEEVGDEPGTARRRFAMAARMRSFMSVGLYSKSTIGCEGGL